MLWTAKVSVLRHLERRQGRVLGVSGSSHDPEEDRPEEDPHPYPIEICSKDSSGLCNNHRPLWPPSLLRSGASPGGSALRPQTQAVGTGKPLPAPVLGVTKGPWGEHPSLAPAPHPASGGHWERSSRKWAGAASH